MRKKKLLILAALLLFISGLPAIALAYNMMPADELKVRIEKKEPTILLDIQKKTAYKERHFYGSIRTFAYPARTDKDLQSVMQAVRMYEQTGNIIVIIGPRGGKASQRTVEYLLTRRVPENKIFILEGGIWGWPYKEMLLSFKGGCE